jgi:hypothetical protein
MMQFPALCSGCSCVSWMRMRNSGLCRGEGGRWAVTIAHAPSRLAAGMCTWVRAHAPVLPSLPGGWESCASPLGGCGKSSAVAATGVGCCCMHQRKAQQRMTAAQPRASRSAACLPLLQHQQHKPAAANGRRCPPIEPPHLPAQATGCRTTQQVGWGTGGAPHRQARGCSYSQARKGGVCVTLNYPLAKHTWHAVCASSCCTLDFPSPPPTLPVLA